MNEGSPDAVRRALATLRLVLESDLAFGIEEIRAAPPPAMPAPRSASPAGATTAREPSFLRPAPRAAPTTPAKPGRPAPPAAPLLVPPLAEQLGPADRVAALAAIGAEAAVCTLCRLGSTRTLAVPGEGRADADLMFIGEGPGADEDRSGRPFVGAAGELLTKIVKAIGFSRETVYICNIVKCRPPGNRTPQREEIDACMPYLRRQIEIVRPKVICTLGAPATRALLGVTTGITALRGRVFAFGGIPVVPTFHPAYLLRTPEDKPLVWADVRQVAKLVAERGGTVPFPDVLARANRGPGSTPPAPS